MVGNVYITNSYFIENQTWFLEQKAVDWLRLKLWFDILRNPGKAKQFVIRL